MNLLQLSTVQLGARVGSAGLLSLLMLTGCGTSSGSDATGDVASLGGIVDGAETAAAAPEDTAQAALDYTQCMRDNGVDMADPTFDADGNIEGGLAVGGGAGGDIGVDPRSEEFQAAISACSDLLDGLDLGGGRGGDFDRSTIEDGLLAYTACLRDEGLSVDDITFGAPGADGTERAGGQAPADSADQADGFAGRDRPAAGEGGRPGGQGVDPSAQIVAQLGLDQDDPEVAAALDACAPVLESAFTAATES